MDQPSDTKEPEVVLEPYHRKTPEELLKLAEDIDNNLVFLSTMIRKPDDFTSSFMIFALAEKKTLETLKAWEVFCFYEYYSEAGPRCCNGYPIFWSAKFLQKDEYSFIVDAVKKMRAAREEVKNKMIEEAAAPAEDTPK